MEIKIETYQGTDLAKRQYLVRVPGLDEPIRVIRSPFANCQTFCIACAYYLCSLSNEQFEEAICKIYYHAGERRQLVVDLRKQDSEIFIEKIKPLTRNIISTSYESTNGSDMIMHIIQFNRSIIDNKKW